jgi:hypothetical protein
MFSDGKSSILSPGVSENNGKYWFDVRQVNLNRLDVSTLVFVIRIVPDKFVVEKFINLDNLFTERVMDNRPNSGNVWGIYVDIGSIRTVLYNIKASDRKNPVYLFELDTVSAAIRIALGREKLTEESPREQ